MKDLERPDRRLWLLLFLPAFGFACVGQVNGLGEMGQGGRAGGQISPGAGGAVNGSSGAMNPLPPPPPGTQTAGRPVARLLSRIELKNSLEDLFGATVTDADLPYRDITVTGLASPATDFLGATDFDKLGTLTRGLAQTFVGKQQGKCADGAGVPACVESFLSAQGRRLFRRPLAAAELDAYKKLYTSEKTRKGHDAGLILALEGMLQSPYFLYRLELGQPAGTGGLQRLTDWELASALSFLVTRSTPDDTLLEAAGGGGLRSAEGVRSQVRRLLGTRRGQEGVLDFYARWLNVHDFDHLEKDPKLFAVFDDAFKASAKRELVETIKREVLSGQGRFQNLLTGRRGFVDAKLAQIYKVTAPATPGPVDLDSATRAGVFTQAAFLAAASKENDTDPMHAGALIFRQVLCQPFPPPPDNPFLVPFTPDPAQSRRQNLDRRTTTSGVCSACHTVMNPVAFAFDAFDAVGRHRTSAEGHMLDTSGQLKTTRDADGAFANVTELMQLLAKSKQVSECHVSQWLRYALGRELEAADEPSVKRTHDVFAQAGFEVLTMLTELVQSDAFLYRKKI